MVLGPGRLEMSLSFSFFLKFSWFISSGLPVALLVPCFEMSSNFITTVDFYFEQICHVNSIFRILITPTLTLF